MIRQIRINETTMLQQQRIARERMVEELQYAINVQRFEEQRADEIRSQQQRDCCDTLPRYYSMAFAVLALPGEFEQYRVKSFLRSNALLQTPGSVISKFWAVYGLSEGADIITEDDMDDIYMLQQMALIDAKIVSFWRSERERIQRWDEYMCTILDTPILTAFSNNYTRMGDLVSAIEETLNATAGSFLFLEDLNTVQKLVVPRPMILGLKRVMMDY